LVTHPSDPKRRKREMCAAILYRRNCRVCDSKESLHACSSCKVALYCSKNCQKADWPQHKDMCNSRKEFCKLHKETPFGCWECDGPTTIYDKTCECVSVFCAKCCDTTLHERGSEECKEIRAMQEAKAKPVVDVFRADKIICRSPPHSMEMCDKIGESYYFTSRVLSSKPRDVEDVALSRALMICAAALGWDWAVIAVGHMGEEESKHAYDFAK